MSETTGPESIAIKSHTCMWLVESSAKNTDDRQFDQSQNNTLLPNDHVITGDSAKRKNRSLKQFTKGKMIF